MPPGLSDLSRRSYIAFCTCKQFLCAVTAAVWQLVYSYHYACFLLSLITTGMLQVLVTGSLYLVGDVLKLLNKAPV